MLKPAVGGLLLGTIAYAFPHVSDGGYGWIQMAREERPDEIVAMLSKRDIVDYYYGRSTS